jgi:hypothetical protein
VSEKSGGSTATAAGTATVNDQPPLPTPPIALTGGLLLGSFSSGNRLITNVNRPTFSGTATPFAIVQLFAQRAGSDPTVTTSLGQTIAAPPATGR